ncbi:MAG: hypothetical protein ACTSRI_16500 [Promethearchaeota archaeon]
MSEYVNEFVFESAPKEITYYDGETLKLNNEFCFYHNKNKFRRELNRLQYLFKDYFKIPLLASGIRDSYLSEEFSNKYLIIIFTTQEIVKEVNEIINARSEITIPPGCFYLETTSKFILLLVKDMKRLILGVDMLEKILKQTFDHYFSQKKFNEYIQIRPFKMIYCEKS